MMTGNVINVRGLKRSSFLLAAAISGLLMKVCCSSSWWLDGIWMVTCSQDQ